MTRDIGDELFGEYFPADEELGQQTGSDEYEKVTCVRETAKALIVKFDGTSATRAIPKSHIVRSSDVHGQGDVGTLRVTAWLGRKLDEEDLFKAEMAQVSDEVALEGAVVLAEFRSGKAIEVRLASGQEVVIPTSQISEASEVRHDGDMGRLVISRWIAREKGLVE